MKCPNCGSEFEPQKPPPSYNGWLKPYLPTILEMLRHALEAQHGNSLQRPSWNSSIARSVHHIPEQYGLPPPPRADMERDHRILEARAHGTTLRELAETFSLSRASICKIIERHQDEADRQSLRTATLAAATIDDVPIASLDIPTNARTSLMQWGGYKTVGEVRKLSKRELLKLHGFGQGSLQKWEEQQELGETPPSGR
jgi:Mor family transcriptional regulator